VNPVCKLSLLVAREAVSRAAELVDSVEPPGKAAQEKANRRADKPGNRRLLGWQFLTWIPMVSFHLTKSGMLPQHCSNWIVTKMAA
jgi:hypothetical protein